MRLMLSAFGAVAVFFTAQTAGAAVLDFNGNICGPSGVAPCTTGAQFGQSYGDIPGQLDVSYAGLSGPGNSPVTEAFLRFWDVQYSDLTNIAWSGAHTNDVAQIVLQGLAGAQVRLNGFDLGAFPNVSRLSQVSIFDGDYNLLASTGPITVDGTVHSHFDFALTRPTIIIQWGPDSFDVGIDNINFTLPAVDGVTVPEPGTLALLGMGLAGFIRLRRR
jgi:hypothetical protein